MIDKKKKVQNMEINDNKINLNKFDKFLKFFKFDLFQSNSKKISLIRKKTENETNNLQKMNPLVFLLNCWIRHGKI